MADDFEQVVEQAITLELKISELYLCFCELFEDEKDFWWELALEEKNHAALIRSAWELFRENDMFPKELLLYNLDELRQTNVMLSSLIRQYKENPPSKQEAFAIALEIEDSAAEMHFQEFMEKEDSSQIVKIFQKLNNADRDHYLRIQAYMQEKGISLYSNEEAAV